MDQTASGEERADGPLPAGAFAAWLAGMERALGHQGESDVPCGACTSCCTSSQFVHIEPDETETLARIPVALQFPAPRAPKGHVLLGYDERGRCPMLIDDACSIYEHRPRTCRTYDCRVFPATGVVIEDPAQQAIARRAQRWEFDHPAEADRVEHEAVRAAAVFIRDHEDQLPESIVPVNATQRAVLAIRVHDAFLRDEGEAGRRVIADPDAVVFDAVVRARPR
jgi:Fe-S-cluster containining protein